MVNGPSVFEPLKFYYNRILHHAHALNGKGNQYKIKDDTLKKTRPAKGKEASSGPADDRIEAILNNEQISNTQREPMDNENNDGQ